MADAVGVIAAVFEAVAEESELPLPESVIPTATATTMAMIQRVDSFITKFNLILFM